MRIQTGFQTGLLAALVATACILGTAVAQGTDPKATNKSTDCTGKAEVGATPIEKGDNSGAKNMGTTGWSGGMREPGSGSSADKQPSKSASEQPERAKGLDPTKPQANKPC
jgi:hypothetical protein